MISHTDYLLSAKWLLLQGTIILEKYEKVIRMKQNALNPAL